jgi:hypothetical protein
MKTSIYILGMAFLLLSCTTDDIVYLRTAAVGSSTIVQERSLPDPYNTAGRMYRDALQLYRQTGNPHATRGEVMDKIEGIMISLGAPPAISLTDLGENRDVTAIPEKELDRLLANSWLGPSARDRLRHLVLAVPPLQGQDRETLEQFIGNYQTGVGDSNFLSEAEKQVILTTTFLILYATEDPDDRTDKDWEISVGNMTAVVEGALQDPNMAVYMLLVERLSPVP